MYDWPEVRAAVDAQWAAIRDRLRADGIDAPGDLTRQNTASGGLDLAALWRHPALLFAQTCWGPMGLGLDRYVQVIGQPDYSDYEGGDGPLYSSAVVMRRADGGAGLPAPADGHAVLPLDHLRGAHLACNSADSMSGILALERDLNVMGETVGIFSGRIVSGGHRASIVAVAEGRADVAAIDCRSWAMAQRFEPAAKGLVVVGWTARREGLPFITAKGTPSEAVAVLKATLEALK